LHYSGTSLRAKRINLGRLHERDGGRKETFQYKGGIREFVEHLNKAKEPVHDKVISIVADFFTATWTALGVPPRLVATRANGQPAFALYAHDPRAGEYRALGLLVLTLTARGVSAITRFEAGVLSAFALPLTMGNF